jgi:hypothetical protein
MILDLMGEKMLSNQLLTGQEVGGALVPKDAGNILQVAVNRLLRGVKTWQVNGIFATHLCLPVLVGRPGRHWRRQTPRSPRRSDRDHGKSADSTGNEIGGMADETSTGKLS